MALRGERFRIDLSSDEEEREQEQEQALAAKAGPKDIVAGFIKDVQERSAATAQAPVAPTLKSASSGFPAHKKRSKFKQQRVQAARAVNYDAKTSVEESTDLLNPLSSDSANENHVDTDGASFDAIERRGIDQENRQRLRDMSDETIAKERQELMEGLSPSLIERLLRRSTIDDVSGETADGDNYRSSLQAANRSSRKDSSELKSSKTVAFDLPDESGSLTSHHSLSRSSAPPTYSASPSNLPPLVQYSKNTDDTAAPPSPTAATNLPLPTPPETRGPNSSPPPHLDPSSPHFLTDLHEKYYPSLAADPSKLAWMTSASPPPSDPSTTYDPTLDTIASTALRFSFTGALLAPKTSLGLDPTATRGLHHHGDAPDAAGYTIPELAHLARSAFPAQRCLAYRTLGRILYRLASGEWGPQAGEMTAGLWGCMQRGRVVEALEGEAAVEDGAHMSARAYALEALWLWRKGLEEVRAAGVEQGATRRVFEGDPLGRPDL